MSSYLVILNKKTLYALLISLIVLFLSYRFSITYNIDLTLISIAIIFPLVFTIRGAFRRREKAIEHLSLFRGSLKTVENIIRGSKLEESDIKRSLDLITKCNKGLIDYLSDVVPTTKSHDDNIEELYSFLLSKRDVIGGGTLQKVSRFLKETSESADNLVELNTN